MAFKVNAQVVDIHADVPRKADRIFIDTNIIILLGYTNASVSGASADKKPYIDYVNNALKVEAELYLCPLLYSEVANVIENKEFDLVKAQFPQIGTGKKQFRQDPRYRSKVITAVQDAWMLAKSFTNIIPITIDQKSVDDAEVAFQNYDLAGYDLFIYQSMLSSGINHIISHDADFGCAPNIVVHTANTFLLRQARMSQKILKR
jgi:predicted nucleic acid-binding protein